MNQGISIPISCSVTPAKRGELFGRSRTATVHPPTFWFSPPTTSAPMERSTGSGVWESIFGNTPGAWTFSTMRGCSLRFNRLYRSTPAPAPPRDRPRSKSRSVRTQSFCHPDFSKSKTMWTPVLLPAWSTGWPTTRTGCRACTPLMLRTKVVCNVRPPKRVLTWPRNRISNPPRFSPSSGYFSSRLDEPLPVAFGTFQKLTARSCVFLGGRSPRNSGAVSLLFWLSPKYHSPLSPTTGSRSTLRIHRGVWTKS